MSFLTSSSDFEAAVFSAANFFSATLLLCSRRTILATSSWAFFSPMKSGVSGWSESMRTIRAALRDLPPDLMAPAMRSQPLLNEIGPEERPLPEIGSWEDRSLEMLIPAPDPDAKTRPSTTWWWRIDSMESSTSVRKHAALWGRDILLSSSRTSNPPPFSTALKAWLPRPS